MSKFDLDKELAELQYPRMFIAGLKFHIENNKIAIKSKKELDKVIEDFKKIEI